MIDLFCSHFSSAYLCYAFLYVAVFALVKSITVDAVQKDISELCRHSITLEITVVTNSSVEFVDLTVFSVCFGLK